MSAAWSPELLGEALEPKRSDFEALDELQTPRGQIRRQIQALRLGGPLRYRERLAQRLEFLIEAMNEEGEEWNECSAKSLHQMVLFLAEQSGFAYPTVTVTPSGTFRAQWTKSPSAHFAVEFLPDGEVCFVAFSVDPRHPNRTQRVSGTVGRLSLMDAVEPYKVHRWAADAGT